MVNAGAPLHGCGHRFAVAQVGEHPLHVEAGESPVVVSGMPHHPHSLALGEQAANQVGAKVAGGPCNQRDACAHWLNPE